MVIGFNKQFPDKIIAGTKLHTIREDVHNRWRAGMTMHMATGVRTKQYKCFKLDVCNGTQIIEIKWSRLYKDAPRAAVYVDDRCIGSYTNMYPSGFLKVLARNDGFDSVQEFFEWFKEDFKGKLIHWTDLRY
ncbi:MAG: hypothetical protein WCG93_12075 [Paludibacter sp.]